MGEYHFAGQYQQQPLPLGGGLVKRAWFKEYAAPERPQCFERVVQSWDTANKASELADFSVCTTWGIQDKHIYLLHVLRKRMDYPTLKRAVWEQYELFKPATILIEDHGSGTQLLQEFKLEGLYAVQGVKPEGSKLIRLDAQTATIQNRFVHLPKEAPWRSEYVQELTSFPYGKHDDQVDSTSQALAWIKAGVCAPGMGMFHFIKEAAEALHPRQ
jgi:predicted phage terminase large subunit-like protein